MLSFQKNYGTLAHVAGRKKTGRGGARPGAGRPALMRDPVVFSVTVERNDYDALSTEAESRGVTLATVVREALRAYARRRRR